jgi:oligoendopeptidase F
MDAAYTNWSEPNKLSAEDLCRTWLAVTQEIYGAEGEIFTYENMDHLWSYVSHFHHPFYVYSYAFGELLTQSLYAARPGLGEKFEPLYLDMLSSGATRDVVGLLAPFGLDARSPDFWANGLVVSLGSLIDEAEKLSAEMGI